MNVNVIICNNMTHQKTGKSKARVKTNAINAGRANRYKLLH